MTLWHYLLAFLTGSMVVWVGSARSALRRRWGWATMGLLPFVAGLLWLTQIWVRLDWEASFWSQEPILLVGEFLLLALVWVGAILVWVVRPGRPGR